MWHLYVIHPVKLYLSQISNTKLGQLYMGLMCLYPQIFWQTCLVGTTVHFTMGQRILHNLTVCGVDAVCCKGITIIGADHTYTPNNTGLVPSTVQLVITRWASHSGSLAWTWQCITRWIEVNHLSRAIFPAKKGVVTGPRPHLVATPTGGATSTPAPPLAHVAIHRKEFIHQEHHTHIMY